MDRRWFSIAALPALLLVTPPSFAGNETGNGKSLAGDLPAISPLSLELNASALAAPVASTALAACEKPEASTAAWTSLESIRYRPRHRWRDRDRDRDRETSSRSSSSGFAQLHGGFFDPDGDPPSAVLFGARAGADLDDKFQLGLGIDWSHRSDRTAAVVTEVPLPGGGTAEQQRVLAQSSSNLIPMTAFLQVMPGSDLPFTPYFGVGGGYEVLFLDAEDFETGDEFSATYGGWGWQAWAGASAQISGQTRLAGEVFWNDAELERDVDDPDSGLTLREIIPQNGLGMRVGLSWGF